MYPDPEIHNKAVFTTIPLRDEAVRRGLIQVPRDQVYTQTYRSPMGVSQQLVPLNTPGRNVSPLAVYGSSPQVFFRQAAPATVTRLYDEAPLSYTAPQPVFISRAPDPVVSSSVCSWTPYALKEPLVTCSTVQTVESVSRAVQVSQEKGEFVEGIGKDAEAAGRDSGSFDQLESTNHTVSGEEEKSELTVVREGTLKGSSLSLGTAGGAEPRGDQDGDRKASEQINKKVQSSGEDFESNRPVDETEAAEARVRTTTTASEAVSTPRLAKDQAVHAVFHGIRPARGTNASVTEQLVRTAACSSLIVWRPRRHFRSKDSSSAHSLRVVRLVSVLLAGVKGETHPIGFVPPEDPRDYKELRIGDSIYLMGGTFYLSDTGAYLLGLRN